MEMGSECSNKGWNCRTTHRNYPQNAPRGNCLQLHSLFWVKVISTQRLQTEIASFPVKPTYLLVSLSTHPDQFYRFTLVLISNYWSTTVSKIATEFNWCLLSADFSPILKSIINYKFIDYKFGCINKYYLLVGKTSGWDSEIQKCNMLHI